MAETLDLLKSELINRVTIQLEFNYGDIGENSILLGYFFDDAISEIKKWLKLENEDEILTGIYNPNISKFMIRKYQEQGIEGQISSSVGVESKKFGFSPTQELLSSIVQRV